MGSEEIKKLREGLGLSQAKFGDLLGAHPMTVSKWERGELTPNDYQQILMKEFEFAANDEKVKENLKTILIGAGIAAAIYFLLKQTRG